MGCLPVCLDVLFNPSTGSYSFLYMGPAFLVKSIPNYFELFVKIVNAFFFPFHFYVFIVKIKKSNSWFCIFILYLITLSGFLKSNKLFCFCICFFSLSLLEALGFSGFTIIYWTSLFPNLPWSPHYSSICLQPCLSFPGLWLGCRNPPLPTTELLLPYLPFPRPRLQSPVSLVCRNRVCVWRSGGWGSSESLLLCCTEWVCSTLTGNLFS